MTVCTYALNLCDPGVAGLLSASARALLREAGVWVVACVGHSCGLFEKALNQSVESRFEVDDSIRMDLISREYGVVGDGLRFSGYR